MPKPVQLIFLGDTSKLETSFRKATADATAFDKKMDALGKTGDKLSALGGNLTRNLTLPLAAGLAFAGKSASDLNEAANVTGLVFKEARGEIDKFVKSSASGLGQSERAAREATASFGGLLQNLGLTSQESVKWSMDLTRLASDMGSAFNKAPEEAVRAIGAALRGETEPIRAFNVVLSDAEIRSKAVSLGLASTAAEADKTDKAYAALKYRRPRERDEGSARGRRGVRSLAPGRARWAGGVTVREELVIAVEVQREHAERLYARERAYLEELFGPWIGFLTSLQVEVENAPEEALPLYGLILTEAREASATHALHAKRPGA